MADDGVQPGLVFTNTVLDGYARQLKYYSAFDFLLRMQSKGVQPDATSFAHVLRACVGARVPSQAARAVTLMREAGIERGITTNAPGGFWGKVSGRERLLLHSQPLPTACTSH